MDRKRALRQFRELKKRGGMMRLAADGWNEEWKTLISTIMSAQTRDETTIPVAESLFKRYNSVRKLAKADVRDVEKIIGRVNYHRTKANKVVACCQKLVSDFGSEVPHDVEKLLTLPGVGRKTANVFLAEAGYRTIGVDTHVNYISNYLGWASSRNPHKVEGSLKELFSEKYWGDINWVLVRFGKNHTSKRKKDKILDEIKEIK